DAIGQIDAEDFDPDTHIKTVHLGANRSFDETLDSRGNITHVEDDLSSNGVDYAYDTVFNQLTSTTDELNHTTEYQIDGFGSVTQIRRDGVTIRRYTYTASIPKGLVDTETDELGTVTDYDYDQYGRLTKTTFASGSSASAFREYHRDQAGNVTSLVDENGHSTGYSYDAMNRVVTQVNAKQDRTTYAYDPAGDLTLV